MDIARGVGRYAPSPSGELHLGNLRTAMLAWLFARCSDRAFIIRIEDLDRERDSGAAEQQLEDLSAIGIDWDATPIRQTERGMVYEKTIQDLIDAGYVYECTCSRKDIATAPSAPHFSPGEYPGTCRALSDEERSAARANIFPRLPALRIRIPQVLQKIGYRDRQLGFVYGKADDFVLRRGDGAIAYTLAVVIDDAAAGVDQVVRGDDLAASTTRQIALQKILSLPTPEYAHVPLVEGPSGNRLAKRDGAVTLSQLRAAGLSAGRVRSILAESLGLATAREDVSMDQLMNRFDPDQLPRTPWTWTDAHSS